MKKDRLRVLYKQKRERLTDADMRLLQENIYQQVYKLDFSGVATVHLFLTLQKFKEINTQPILHFFRKKGIRIIVSKCNFKTNTLSHFYLEENTLLETNKYGVPEPIVAEKANEIDIDMVFVPLLISDKRNYRVGYGKGFYDKFLAKCKNNTQFIGLNLFEPIESIEDVNAFDVVLDSVIWPK